LISHKDNSVEYVHGTVDRVHTAGSWFHRIVNCPGPLERRSVALI
jgi:hypothetical protein